MSIHIHHRVTMLAVVLTGALTLTGCGDQPPANLDQASTIGTPPSAAGTPSSTPTPAALVITNWGPRSTPVGKAFNVQPSGNSALWATVNQSLVGKAVTVELNNVPLPGAAVSANNNVTAEVPPKLYAEKGSLTLRITANANGRRQQSNVVTLVVQ